MSASVYRDPTFDAVVRNEIREKKGCGVCTRSLELMPGQFVCNNNKRYPACKRENKGFEYDLGE